MVGSSVIAVRLTAPAPGAIAVILLAAPGDAGGGLAEVLQRLARSARAAALPVGGYVRTALVSAEGAVLDDALVVRTGAGQWELHLHGGVAVVDGVLAALRGLGVRVAEAEEVPGVLAPGVEGELLVALPRAVTETGVRLLLAQGRVWREFAARWQGMLRQPGAGERLWQVQSAAQWSLRRSRALARLLEPARVAIIGAPNAGKSTLANALLGRPVSITSATAGTTRDWVDAQAVFACGGVQVPVILVDTAGVRDTHDVLERTSIARTHDQAAEADVIVLLLDATREPSAGELALLESYRGRALVVAANKSDALAGAVLPRHEALGALVVSAKTRVNLEGLMAAVLGQLELGVVGEECFAFTARQRGMLVELSQCDTPTACGALLSQLACYGGTILQP